MRESEELYAAFAVAKKYCVKATAPSAVFVRAGSGTPAGTGRVVEVVADDVELVVVELTADLVVDVGLSGSVAGVVQAPSSVTAPNAVVAA